MDKELPRPVLERCGEVNFQLQKSPRMKPFIAHVEKMKLCYSRSPGKLEDSGVVGVTVMLPRNARALRFHTSGREQEQRSSEENNLLAWSRRLCDIND